MSILEWFFIILFVEHLFFALIWKKNSMLNVAIKIYCWLVVAFIALALLQMWGNVVLPWKIL